MNIALLTRMNPNDINVWSGTIYHIYQTLKEKHNVEIIGTEILQQIDFFSKMNHTVITFPEIKYYEKLSKLLSERINRFDFDLIFLGDVLMNPLTFNIPFVALSDINFEQRKEFFKPPCKELTETCLRLEKLFLDKTFRIIYTSEWIKRKTVEYYNIDPKKIDIVEFGANIPTPTDYTIEISMDICRLVFIGKNWEKKGGDKVLQAYIQLKKEGFPCSLTIIGSTPKEAFEDEDDDLIVIPSIDKSKKDQLDELCGILSKSHFLVLPTVFDAFGIVFCEASAYGVPSIATNVGGVGQTIKEGKNGFLMPPDATASDYVEKIKTVFSDKECYYSLRRSSRKEFETRLNWDVWGERVNRILEDAVREHKEL